MTHFASSQDKLLPFLRQVFCVAYRVIIITNEGGDQLITERLLELRNKKRLSQNELAKRLGIARTTYAGYENGSREPDIEMINKLAEFHGVKVSYLIEENKKESAATLPESEYDRVIKELEETYNVSLRDDPIVLSSVRQMIEIIAQTKRDKG